MFWLFVALQAQIPYALVTNEGDVRISGKKYAQSSGQSQAVNP